MLKIKTPRFDKTPNYQETMRILEPYLARTREDFIRFLSEGKKIYS